MIPEFLAPFAAQLELYKLESIKITATPLTTERPASTASKFRGLPYLPLTVPYPVDEAGRPMLLLAQINLQELPANSMLPAEGLLQFYISASDYSDMDESKVLYFRPEQLQTEIRQDYSFLPSTHYEDSPVYCEHELGFAETTEYGGIRDYRFDLTFDGSDASDYAKTLSEAERQAFEKLLSATGHKIGGYAFFTQGNPHEYSSAPSNDVQLLQIDIDEEIMFGDSGVAHFFINEQALKEGRFEEAYFYWDCC